MSATANVRRLEAEPGRDIPPVGTAPGLGFSLQVDLGAGRVCTLQTFVPSDCSARELNLMLDKMTAAGDRQRAHYQIEGFVRDLRQFEKEQAQGEEDLVKIVDDFTLAQERRVKEIAKAEAALANFEAAQAQTHAASGRRGAVELKGAQRANFLRVQNGVNELKAKVDVALEEHNFSMTEAKKVLAKRAQLIAKTQAEIAQCEELVRAGLVA